MRNTDYGPDKQKNIENKFDNDRKKVTMSQEDYTMSKNLSECEMILAIRDTLKLCILYVHAY